MQRTIRRGPVQGMITVQGEARSMGEETPKSLILQEIRRLSLFWRRERLGVGLPPRR
jgi:hypothetical protein